MCYPSRYMVCCNGFAVQLCVLPSWNARRTVAIEAAVAGNTSKEAKPALPFTISFSVSNQISLP